MVFQGNIRQLTSELLGSRYIWPAPELLRQQTSETTTPLEITGLAEVYLPQASRSLGAVSVAIFNALQTLTAQAGREELFSWGDIERELSGERYDIDMISCVPPVALARLAIYFEHLAEASTAPIERVILAQRRKPQNPRGSGNPFQYRFNPQVFFVDRRVIPEDLLMSEKHNNTAAELKL